jgi:hypothetical protein
MRASAGGVEALQSFHKKGSDRQVATRVLWAQTGPIATFDGRSGRRIQARRTGTAAT